MKRIYLMADDKDAESASELETLLKQRGFFVRRADAAAGFMPAQPGELTLALWSTYVLMSNKLITFTHRVMDAWSENKLIFARLDHAILPRGLSDLETLDLSFEASRRFKGNDIVNMALALDAPLPAPASPAPAPSTPPEPAMKSAGPGQGFLFLGLLSALLLAALVWILRDRIGSGAIVIAAALGLLAVTGAGLAMMRRPRARLAKKSESVAVPAPGRAEAPRASNDAPVFFSYSIRDGEKVYPLADAVEAAGQPIWIDRKGLQTGTEWAGEIVRAIRSAERVCLMCSANSFSSDNVRREVYLADKFKRPLVPVRLDQTEYPDDLHFFLVDKQWLDLSGLSPAEQRSRMIDLLAE